jgi:hypothetical protein
VFGGDIPKDVFVLPHADSIAYCYTFRVLLPHLCLR